LRALKPSRYGPLSIGAVLADEVIDLLLLAAHARDVVGEGSLFGLVGERRLEAEQLHELFLVGVVERGALLQEDAEVRVELHIAVGPLGGLLVEELEEALGDDLAQLLEQGLVLHGLARDVQREILAVYDALEETQPLGQQILRRGVDQDLAAVEGHGGLETGEAETLGVFLRDEEQGVDRERGVGREVQAQDCGSS
jgi:hypothetical protein